MKFSPKFIENLNLEKKQKVTLTSVIIAIGLIAVSLFTNDAAVIGNVFIISVALVLIPFILYKYSRMAWIKNVEDEFPNFVRDMAESKRSGMSLPEAVKLSSKTSYGKLTPEVRKMHNRLSWGTPFLRAIEIFRKSVKESRMINEALNIITESYKSGGNVASTLDAIARDMLTLKEAEAQRQSTIKTNVYIMYGVFFMFLGIAVVIIQVMVPLIKSQPATSSGVLGLQFSDPCKNAGSFPCNLFFSIGAFLGVSQGVAMYYIALFFTVVIIQGIFTGLISGQLSDNSVTAGVKHSFIMVFIAMGVFIFMAQAGLFPK